MNGSWQLQDAKNRFSEVVDKACREGPQTVTRRGRPTVVVVSVSDYRRLRRGASGLVDFLRRSPLRGMELYLKRARHLPRKVDL
jgi:prevent-host-death family protein